MATSRISGDNRGYTQGDEGRPSHLSAEAIEALFDRLAEARPEPQGELTWVTPFTLLVAVVLSAQATDKSVNKATQPLFAVADTPERLLALGEDGVREYIRSIGLFNTKARNLIALARTLVEEYGGEVPRERAALEALPGVGRKTANVVLNIAFGEPTIAVDTHVLRVCNRTGLAPGRTPLAVERGLDAVVPPARRRHAHHWLILHGRYVCKISKARRDRGASGRPPPHAFPFPPRLPRENRMTVLDSRSARFDQARARG